MEVPEIENIWA